MHQRTSLREESAESVVGVLLLALLGEVSIGLFVIKISAFNLFTINNQEGHLSFHIPECRAQDSKAKE